MDNEKHLTSPVLADRIQLSISIKYITETINIYQDNGEKLPFENIEGKDKESYYQAIFSEYLKEKRKNNIHYDREKKQYYIHVPEESYIEEYPFISNIRIRLNNPYTITLEFNFNRFIRYYAEDYPNFDHDYDIATRVGDNNYINKRVWKDWDNDLVKNLPEKIPMFAFDIAQHIINQYIEDFNSQYETLTIKQIEFSKDYYVGHHRATDVFHDLKYFIISSSGVDWINSLSAYAMNIYNDKETNKIDTKFQGDHYTPTIKFDVSKGLKFKIYVKTTDYIRLELTQTTTFIKRKYKRQSYYTVYGESRKVAKDFIRKADFETIINRSIDNTYSDYFSITDNIYKFLEEYDVKLASVCDAYAHRRPIVYPDLISYVRANKKFRGMFKSSYLGNGRRALIPLKEPNNEKTYTRLKPAYKTNRAPKTPKPIIKYIFLTKDGYQSSFNNKLYEVTGKPEPLPKLQRNFRSGNKLRKKYIKL